MKAQTLIVYGSKRGKTAEMAEAIKTILEKREIISVLRNAWEASLSEILASDILVFGSSTWADGDLQADFIDLERELSDADLTGKFAAVFGPGNSRFPRFCEAVEILQERLKNSGASLLLESLKADRLAANEMAETRVWAEKLADKIIELEHKT
jgi:flavodoxin I